MSDSETVVVTANAAVRRFSAFQWMAVVLGVVLLILVIGTWRLNAQLNKTQREFAARFVDTQQHAQATSQIAQEAVANLSDLQKKQALLENRVLESQAQQASLEQLYAELSRNRDEVQAAEIEQLVVMAAQQLQLAGNVAGALILLQNADARLARADKPQFLGVRRALSRDIERLKALPNADISGLIFKLDQLSEAVDAMPLLMDAKPTPPEMPTAKTKTSAWWQKFWQQLSEQAVPLIRVRKIEHPEAMLLAPPQAYFVRENLKLRLLNARLQLLSRQEAAFRADLLQIRDLARKYFDLQHKPVQSFLQLVDQLERAQVVVALPTLGESLNSVSQFRPAAELRKGR